MSTFLVFKDSEVFILNLGQIFEIVSPLKIYPARNSRSIPPEPLIIWGHMNTIEKQRRSFIPLLLNSRSDSATIVPISYFLTVARGQIRFDASTDFILSNHQLYTRHTMRWQQRTSGHSYMRVLWWLKLIYTLKGKNLTNTSYVQPPGSHVRQLSAKSLLGQNQALASGMKSWLPVTPAWPSFWATSFSLQQTTSKQRGVVRRSSYWATRFIRPHKTRYAVSTNQGLPSVQKWRSP
jgi:hypothetical protein